MMNYIRKKKARKGFTLVELVVVVAIVAVLTAVAAPRFMSMTDGAKVAAVKSNLEAVRTAVTLYLADGHDIKDIDATGKQLASYMSTAADDDEIFTNLTGNPKGATYTVNDAGKATLNITCELAGISDSDKYLDAAAGVTYDPAGDDGKGVYEFIVRF